MESVPVREKRGHDPTLFQLVVDGFMNMDFLNLRFKHRVYRLLSVFRRGKRGKRGRISNQTGYTSEIVGGTEESIAHGNEYLNCTTDVGDLTRQ